MKTGLFFGSFNPVHVGHMIIANYMTENSDLDEVWMVVSPQNPLKKRSNLANDYDRLHLVNLAIGKNFRIKVSDIEFYLPKPSYTIDTLSNLREKYPKRSFALVMGGDNLASLHKWKNFESILAYYEIYVYKRPGYSLNPYEEQQNIYIFDAPQMHISASYIRKIIKEGNKKEDLATIMILEDGTIQISGKKILIGRHNNDGGQDTNGDPYMRFSKFKEYMNDTLDAIDSKLSIAGLRCRSTRYRRLIFTRASTTRW